VVPARPEQIHRLVQRGPVVELFCSAHALIKHYLERSVE